MKTIVIEDVVARLSLEKTPLLQFMALCKQRPKSFLIALGLLTFFGCAVGVIIEGLFVEKRVDPVYFAVALLLMGVFYGFMLTQMLPSKIERSVAVWGSICYLIYNCFVIALALRGMCLDYKAPSIAIDPRAIQEQARQQILLNSLRPGDIVILKGGEMWLVVPRSGLWRQNLLPYVTCLGAQATTAPYESVTANLRRIVRRRDHDYPFLSQRFLAAEKCPVVVR